MKTISITGAIPHQDYYGFLPKFSLLSKAFLLLLLLQHVPGLALGQNLCAIPIQNLPHSVILISGDTQNEFELWLGTVPAPLENVQFVRVLLELDTTCSGSANLGFEYDPSWANGWFPGALKSSIEQHGENILLELDFGKRGPAFAKGKLGSIFWGVQGTYPQGESPLLRVSGLILVENVDALRTNGDWGPTYDVWKNAFDLKF